MNPERILRSLDSRLTQETRLIVYGRAALALGFERDEFAATLDVDVILPELDMATIEEDHQFWDAVESTNSELAVDGLYLTHLFTDSQVILSQNWLEHIEPIRLGGLAHLTLFRPRTEDLVLTKMMRVDPQDRYDIEFLMEAGSIGSDRIAALAAGARVPDIPEIKEAFAANLR